VLAGFLLVRAAASASVGEPDDALKAEVQKVARPRWFMAGPQVPARLAASLAAMVVGGALWLGLSVRGVPAESPVPLRSQTTTMNAPPAPVPVASPAMPSAGVQAPAVAKPARMLQFEGWREGS
jgi:hypothetical protein